MKNIIQKVIFIAKKIVSYAKRNMGFLHEWVLYDYLNSRHEEKTLRFKMKVKNGQLILKDKWIKVLDLKPINKTQFPDVESIFLTDLKTSIPAEIKFTTSLFEYHRKAEAAFLNFFQRNGVIIVLKHDYIPNGLENYNINVYEIDESDFIAFCKENFSRLLNRQIKKHTETKVWVMYQGGNFNHRNSIIKPANESGLWCPTENLTGFELSIGDRILFIKTNGASTQVVQKEYFKNNIIDKWFLSQIYVGEIKSAIYSRGEYCSFRQIPNNTQLWLNDEIKNNIWRWNRVFEFYNVKTIDTNIEIKELYKKKLMHEFIIALIESFCYQRSREISLKQYRDLLEFLLKR